MAVLPTKGNLIATKHSLELANTGFELMDRKRNILTREMMGLISRAAKIQSRIDSTFSEAYDALMLANISMGKTIHLAEQVPVDDSVEIRYRSVMGVEIPTVSAKPAQQPLPYGLSITNSAFDDALIKFGRVKELVRELEHKYPGLKERVFGAMQRLPLPAWEPAERRRRPYAEETGFGENPR